MAPSVRAKLDEDEWAFDWSADEKAQWASCLARSPWNRYPPAHVDLQRAIAEPLGLTHEWVSLGAGADEMIRNLLIAWGFRGTLVYPIPTNPLYAVIAQSLGVKHVAVLLRADFSLPLEQVVATASSQEANLVLVNNPNNPTGNLFSRDEILSLARECDSLVVVDESYIEISALSVSDALAEHENLAVIRSFSHAWPAASFRLGYLIAHPRVIREVEKVRSPQNVSAPALLAGQWLLAHELALRPRWMALAREREGVREALSQLRDVVSWPSAANFLLVGTTLDSQDLAARLLSRGVLVRSFSRSPLMNCIRVTIGDPELNGIFIEAMESIFGAAV